MTSDVPVIPVLLTEAEIRAALEQVLPILAEGAAERDRTGAVPIPALEAIRRSGLLGITVPAEHGGAGVSAAVLLDVLRLVAAEDPSVAQTFQPHLAALDAVRLIGEPGQRTRLLGAALAGKWIGNATNERGVPQGVQHLRTRITRDGAVPGTLRLSGRKHYSTGAVTADLIAVLALDDEDRGVVAWVPRHADGVTVDLDWNAFGQRGTISGTTLLEEVVVPEQDVVPRWRLFEAPQAHGAFTQLHHVAVDLGILDAAIRDGVEYVRTRSRPGAASPYAANTEDPTVIRAFGEFQIRRSAAAAIAAWAAATYDRLEPAARIEATREAASSEISLAIASAKAFVSQAAIEVSSAFLEFAGAGATDRDLGYDRHWRNARTHSLHDAVRWKVHHVGDHLLNGTPPPTSGVL